MQKYNTNNLSRHGEKIQCGLLANNGGCSNDHSLQVQLISILLANVTDKIYSHADNSSCLS